MEGDRELITEFVSSGKISIHALRVEGDANVLLTGRLYRYFYPRPPGGGRQKGFLDFGETVEISIHALRVEGDC